MNKEQDGGQPPFSVTETALNPTYTMPETTRNGLVDLFEAFASVGQLAEAAELGNGPEIGLSGLAPINRSLAELGKRLMGDVSARFPTFRGQSAQ